MSSVPEVSSATPVNSFSTDRGERDAKTSVVVDDVDNHLAAGTTQNINVDGDQGKFTAMLGLLRKLAGVSDIISLRISLPAQFIDPIPNLEYWNYMERPDYFAAIPDSDDEVERMLAVLKWWFSKLLKHTGRVLKPFNSVLGEQFFCHWEVSNNASGDEVGEERSATSSIATTAVSTDDNNNNKMRVEYITEQVSHHPPVSAYTYRCKDKLIEAVGIDHISAKFSGLSATVSPGNRCKGIFVKLKSRGDEEYRCTHPTGTIGGWLRGHLHVQFVNTCYVVCPKSNMAAIIEFKEEKWFGRTKENVSGKVFRYDAKAQGDLVGSWRLKDIPKTCKIIATFNGNWNGVVRARRVDIKEAERTLIDMGKLTAMQKIVKPLEEQSEMESRRVWEPVAKEINSRNFGDATKRKREIEDRQRAIAAKRKANNEVFVPALFMPEHPDGRPQLIPDAPINL